MPLPSARRILALALLACAAQAAVPVHPEFKVAVLRDPAQWPFERDDPFNTPLGDGAVYEPLRSPAFQAILKDAEHPNKRWRAGTIGDGDFPIHICTPGRHPLRKVIHDSHGLVVEMPVPDEAVRPKSVDYHLVLIPEDRGDWYIEFLGFTRLPDGNVGGSAHRNSLRGSSVYPSYHGCRAWGGSGVAGLIRKGELEIGIRHVLNIQMPSTVVRRKPDILWPAVHSDGEATDSNVFYGSLIAIPPDVDITAVAGTSGPLYEIARALQDYGAYLTDCVAGHHQAIRIDCEDGYQTASDLNKEWQLGKLAPLLHIVANNSKEKPGGGGKRRRPMAPDFTPPGHPGAEWGKLVVRATDLAEEREALKREQEAKRTDREAALAAERARNQPSRMPDEAIRKTFDRRLRDRLEAALGERRDLAFTTSAGAMPVRLEGFDRDIAVLRLRQPGGAQLQVPWSRMTIAEKRQLAQGVARLDAPADQALAAFHVLLAGEVSGARDHLARAGAETATLVETFGIAR